VHKPEERHYISEEIHVGGVLEEWLALEVNKSVPKQGQLASLMNIEDSVVKELETVCGIGSLECEGEPTHVVNPIRKNKGVREHTRYVIPPGHQLTSLKIKSEINSKKEENSNLRHYINSINKYRLHNPEILLASATPINPVTKPIDTAQVILIVNIYQPYKKEGESTKRGLKLEQQMSVLGSQKLSDLRDKFNCLADAAIPEDMSEDPNGPQLTRAQDIYTSGFFYINGIFYNDMREMQSRDYSKVIIEWANSYPDMEIGPFQTRLMEETSFVDLHLRLGYPYVYQHQGFCEHLLVFQDIRLISPEDNQDSSMYPLITCVSKRKRTLCMACSNITARWVTTDNVRVPYDPFFFCDVCFRSFNYTNTGERIGSFRAYPYVDRSALM